MKRLPLNLPLILVVLSWGFNFVSLKILYRDMEPAAVMFMRFFLMGALLAGICRWRGQSLRYPKEDFWRILAVGFMAMGVYMVFFLEGLRHTSPAEGAILLATAPVFTFLLSCALKQEPFSFSALVGSLVAFTGVCIVILGGVKSETSGTLLGNLTVLFSALLWSISVVMMRPLLSKYDAMRVFTLSMPGALPLLVVYGLAATLNTDFAAVSTLGWLMFAQVVLLSGVVAFVCFYQGIHQIGPSRAAMYQFFIPPTAALFQWIFMGQPLVLLQSVGLLVLLAGVIYASRARIVTAERLAPSAEGGI